MPLPRWVARLNKRFTNRLVEPLARRFNNFAVVHHAGRRSGTAYTTPVSYFAADDSNAIVALTYGPSADWIRNVVAGSASLEISGKLLPISQVEVVGREEAWQYLPRTVRIVLRMLRVHHFARLACDDLFTSQ